MKTIFGPFLPVIITFLCVSASGVAVEHSNSMQVEESSVQTNKSKTLEKQITPPSKEEFEIMLASKLQLLKAATEMYADMFSTLTDNSLKKERMVEILKDAEARLKERIKALTNNAYVGERAKQISLVCDPALFEELQAELCADIEIAQSLQIDTHCYSECVAEYIRQKLFLWMLMNKAKTQSGS